MTDAATAPEQRFTLQLRAAAEPDFSAATGHRFARDVADATIPPAVFRRYLVQDYSFLDHFVRLLDAAIATAPEEAARRRYTDFRAAVTSGENTYFLRSFAALGIPETEWREPEILPVTRRFHEIMGEAARSGRYAPVLTVLVVTEWVYLDWATSVMDTVPDQFWFAEWIDIHANPDFRSFVEWLIAELDRLGPTLSDAERAEVRDLFVRTSALEQAFFDQAYG
ncbi:thiaminase/transcriptional activator TenA [Constrictibacter sp. MBR-5]|jgi:thiaminase/transcriptional activator TenA|uniref:TenA family protein n=1 Tax=Constrictibacter sp. MBR-5 TaxID=3156467 RepID=UPI003394A603